MPPAVSNTFTPVRDGFADVLALAAVAFLVAQHWLMPVISPGTGQATAANAATVALAAPLAFVAAGTAGASSADGLGDRLLGLARPVVPFALVCLIWIDGAGRLLWLPAALALVTVMTPALVRLHRRWGGAEIAMTAAGSIALDVVRFGFAGGSDSVGALGVLAVWVLAYQVGIAGAAGGLDRLRVRTVLLVATAGVAVAALALVLGAIATPGVAPGATPGVAPNSVPSAGFLLAGSAAQLGTALAARPLIARWAGHPPVAHALGRLSSRLLTIHLWHLPAFAAVMAVAVPMFGYETPSPFGRQWREDLPWLLLCAGMVLAAFVHVLGGLERIRVGTALLPTHRLTGSSTLGEHERLKA